MASGGKRRGLHLLADASDTHGDVYSTYINYVCNLLGIELLCLVTYFLDIYLFIACVHARAMKLESREHLGSTLVLAYYSVKTACTVAVTILIVLLLNLSSALFG